MKVCTYNIYFENIPRRSPSQFSPAFSEPPSPWVQDDNTASDNVVASQSSSQKQSKNLEEDESLGENSTKSLILYANLNHPELKTEYPGI